MGKKQAEIKNIVYIATAPRPQLEEFFSGKGITTKFLKLGEKLSDCSAADVFLYIFDETDDVSVGSLEHFCHDTPAVLITQKYNAEIVQEGLDAGFLDILPLPETPDQTESLYRRFRHRLGDELTMAKLYEGLKESESRLLEKNTILETILDILTHDTGNIFVNLNSLVDDLPDTPLRGMIKDHINDLHHEMHEAMGYLGHKKRIQNVVELLKSLVVSECRIPLEFHQRIRFTAISRFVLFAECSPLFKNAVVNIIENALKYSPNTETVAVHVSRSGNDIEITVKDSGGGIPDAEKEKIFGRFYRLHDTSEKKGSGRGLWITRNIIEKAGGRLFVGDNKPKGSVFHIIIPAFVLSSPQEGAAMLMDWYGLSSTQIKNKTEAMETLLSLQDIPELEDLPSAVFCNLLEHMRKQKDENEARIFKQRMSDYKRMNSDAPKILIVDDSLYVKYYLASYLVEMGYSVAEYAGTGEEAINLQKELKPDLITMDCTMPVMSGLEAAKKIFESDSRVPILFISGIGKHPLFVRDLEKYFDKNRYAVLTKPFKKEELKKCLTRLLG